MTRKPRIALIASGGTIETVGKSRTDLAWYVDGGQFLKQGEMLARVPEVTAFADISTVQFPKMSSHALTIDNWFELAAAVAAARDRDDIDGVILTHGTNTLEETAYFLQLVLPLGKPVVLTGSMRPASALSPDGDLNLLRAVQVAAAPQSRGQGVLVVMEDAIHSARDVTKAHTARTSAFLSPNIGPIGVVEADGTVSFHRAATMAAGYVPFLLPPSSDLPRVDVVFSYVGVDGIFIDASVNAGARGIVCAGTGSGLPSPLEEEALNRAKSANVVICHSTRVGTGKVLRSPKLKENGIIAAGNLQPWKARILLALGLTQTSDPIELQQMFEQY